MYNRAMVAKKKTFKEEFARFYESPTRESLRELLRNNLGEFPNYDFKEQWPTFSKLARHLLGLANVGGGCVIIGVAEKDDKSLESRGIDLLVDKADVTNGVKKFLPSTLLDDVEIGDFTYDAAEYPSLIGKKFQAIFVSGDPKHLPFVSMADGDGIRSSAIYVRRGSTTDEANYDELQRIINRRLETGYSSQSEIDARTHIEQLKMLYGQVSKHHERVTGGIIQAMEALSKASIFGTKESVPNPIYPKESFEDFIVKMIEKKKKRIEIVLDVVDL
jgi:hypothetical protein